MTATIVTAIVMGLALLVALTQKVHRPGYRPSWDDCDDEDTDS